MFQTTNKKGDLPGRKLPSLFRYNSCPGVGIFNILIIFTSFRVAFCDSGEEMATTYCYPCNELHRKWAHNLCHNDVFDCGECFNGFVVNENYDCMLPRDDIVINDIQPSLLPKGSNVTLQCKSNLIDDCVWTRRGFPVKINGRYHFLESDRRFSDDCSLKISSIQEIDAGHWSCQIYADYVPNDPVEVQNFWLYYFDPDTLSVAENENALIPVGVPVTMMCLFETDVNCEWFNDNVLITMNSSYSYVDSIKRGKETRDCSLRINAFQERDIGRWRCQNKDEQQTRASFKLQSVKEALKITQRPLDQNVVTGGSVVLQCAFSHDVTCLWSKDGKMVTIAGRYLYLDTRNGLQTNNCSIGVQSLEPDDLGQWTCSHQSHDMAPKLLSYSATLMVEPKVKITKTLSNHYHCYALDSFPEAKLQWIVNGSTVYDNYSVRKENGLYTTDSTFDSLDENPGAGTTLVCVIKHPSFPVAKQLTVAQAETVESSEDLNEAGGTGTLPMVISLSVFATIMAVLIIVLFLMFVVKTFPCRKPNDDKPQITVGSNEKTSLVERGEATEPAA